MSKCHDPVLCFNANGTRKFRHYSLANDTFKLAHNLVFNCGKCVFCRRKKSLELAVRCVLHASLYSHNCFLTLTYDESKDGYHNELDYTDIQTFKKRFRQHVARLGQYCCIKTRRVISPGKKIQIFNVHEYGKNGKKHWHLVVFNHDFIDKQYFTSKNGNRLYTSSRLSKLWPHGHHTIGDVTEASAMYQAQYTQKDFKHGNVNNKKKAKSNHSGIGRDYFLKHYEQILQLGYVPFGGQKISIPRYFLKLAHKHWAHFNNPDLFRDFPYRKRVYTPFKALEAPSLRMSTLYAQFIASRNEHIEQIAKEWEEQVKLNMNSDTKPDFVVAAENYLYDLRNRLNTSDF